MEPPTGTKVGYASLCAGLCFMLCLVLGRPGFAEDRFALLIGNADYTEGSRLANPERDVDAFAATLGKLGFQVSAVKNVDQEGFDDALNEFERKLTSGSIALFFYAGHGFQVDGENYLLPLRHGIESKRQVRRECISVSEIVGMLEESRCNLRIVVLDACRNNPFERSWSRGNSVRGFTAIVPPDGTIVAFATAPGEVASDGKGNNSPFTSSLIKTFESASKQPIEIQRLFRLVGQECSRVANQRPYINADASMKDYLLGPVAGEATMSQPKSISPPTPQMVVSNDIEPISIDSNQEPPSEDHTASEDDAVRLGVFCVSSLTGPIIVTVAPGSPASKCVSASQPTTALALSVGDKIQKVNGVTISDGAEFTRAVMQSPNAIRIVVKRRNAQVIEVATVLNGERRPSKPMNHPTRVGFAKALLLQTGLVVAESPGSVGVRITGVISNSVASKIRAESLPGAAPDKVPIANCTAITHINNRRVITLTDADRVVSNEWARLKLNNLPKVLMLNLIDYQGKEYLCHFSD